MLQLMLSVGRIDVDQNGPDPRRRQLQKDPLDIVGRPDADAVTGIETESEKTSCQPVDLMVQLLVGQPAALRRRDDGLPATMMCHHSLQIAIDRIAEKRPVSRTV